MKVSVITVCYNANDCIENAIKSVLSQTYKNIEYIIVDGKSTDGTLNIIDNYRDRISKVISEKDKGIYDAMNKGIQIAIGDVIYFLNSDDRLYDKDVIFDVVNEFNNNPHVGLIYGKVRPVDVPQELAPYVKEYKIIEKNVRFLKEGLCHQSIFTKKWVFDKAGYFDIRYKVYADFDWLLSVYNYPVKLKFIDRYVVTYYYQGYSYQNLNRASRERIAIIYKYFSLPIFLFYVLRYVLIRNLNFKRKRLFRYIKVLF